MQQNDLKTKLLCIIIIVYSDGYTRLDIVGVCVCVMILYIFLLPVSSSSFHWGTSTTGK